MFTINFRILFISLLLTVLSGVLASTSCKRNYKEISVKEIHLEELNISSFKSVDAVLLVDIDNPSNLSVTAEGFTGFVYWKDKKLATFYTHDVLKATPLGVSQSRVKVRVTLEDALWLAEFLLSGDQKLNDKDFTMEICATLKSGIVSIPYVKKDIPLHNFVEKAVSYLKKMKLWKKLLM